MPVHPLIFDPIFKPKVWGGRKLADLLDKKLPPDTAVGESWECTDLPAGRSIVRSGPAKGRSLDQLVKDWAADLTGRAALVDGGFPLLLKFLDARQDLSIQVHPSPAYAARVGGLKHEAWYVIDADPNAAIYRGLKPGVTRTDLAAAVKAAAVPAAPPSAKDTLISLFHRIPVKPGQCFYCPSGTPHALGAGLVVAEVQTPSDVTFRLYDWGRVRPDADAGMHIDEGLEAIDWTAADQPDITRSHVGGLFTTVTRLAACDAFTIEKVRFIEGITQDIPYADMVIWIMLEGRGTIDCPATPSLSFSRGDTIILPAALKAAKLRTETNCTWLEVTIPSQSDLASFKRPSAAQLQSEPPASPSLIQITPSSRS